MRRLPSSALGEWHLVGRKGEIASVGARPETRGAGLAGRVLGFWKQQLRWAPSPRRGRPFVPGASVSLPPSSRLPSRRRWPLGQSLGPQCPRLSSLPAAPQAGPKCCLQVRGGSRRRCRNSLANLSQRLSEPQQPNWPNPSFDLNEVAGASVWGKAIESGGDGGAPGPGDALPRLPFPAPLGPRR